MGNSAKMQEKANDEAAERLRDVFARAALPKDALLAERQLPAETYTDLIHLVAREIDETVLPRKIALVAGERGLATLVVSNRRLIEFKIADTKIGLETDGDADPDMVARIYAHALKKLFAQSGPLHLRLVERIQNVATNSTACSAARLSAFCDAVSFENRMKAFLKLFHGRSKGWIFHSGQGHRVAHDPDAGVFERLSVLDHQANGQVDRKGSLSRLNRSGPVCSIIALSDEIQAIIAKDGDDHLVAAVSNADVTYCLEQWRHVFGREEPVKRG